MVSANDNTHAITTAASERHKPNSRVDSFSETSSCQEEKKDAGSSCGESKAAFSALQHEMLPCKHQEETLAEVAVRHLRRNSTATVSSGSSSSSASAPPKTPQHDTSLRTPENLHLPRNNELLGLSLFRYNPNREAIHKTYHCDGVPENSSDEALERYASRIRHELRHKEMMELAEAAEKAAEAGEERFALRPSTFGSSEWSAMNDARMAQQPANDLGWSRRTPTISATATVPARLTPLLIRKRIQKIGVTELRDVHEVFPDFGEFHTHLRTHMLRGGVNRKTTIFKEKSIKKSDNRFPSSSSSGKRKGLNFLRDLNDWISPLNETAFNQDNMDKTCTLTWDFGNIISEHMNLSNTNSPTALLPSETNESPKQQTSSDRNARHSTIEKQHSTPMSEERGSVRSKRRTVRRALFDEEDFSSTPPESRYLVSQNTWPSQTNYQPEVHLTSQDAVKQRADFVTPVRLRRMRLQSEADDMFDEPSGSVLDNPLYMVNDSERHDKMLDDSGASISSILLPQLSTRSRGKSKLKRHEEKKYGESQYAFINPEEESRDEVYVAEIMPINGFPIIGPLLLDGMPPDIARNDSRQDATGANNRSYDVIQNPQLIALNNESKSAYTSSIQTPLRDDCGCLSIPTNSSLESNESAVLNEDRNLPQLSNVTEENSLYSRQANPLAGLISRMSPSGKIFHTMNKSRLYFRSYENDAFMNNFLYCSKPIERDPMNEVPIHPFCAEPCHDAQGSCIELNLDSCCAAILPDTFHDIPRKAPMTQSYVSLGGTPYAKSGAEVWYDRATEGFDHFLEQLSGGAPSTTRFTAWNRSFRAPSLIMKKVPHADVSAANSSTSERMDDLNESPTDPQQDFNVPSPTISLTRSSSASSLGRQNVCLSRPVRKTENVTNEPHRNLDTQEETSISNAWGRVQI